MNRTLVSLSFVLAALGAPIAAPSMRAAEPRCEAPAQDDALDWRGAIAGVVTHLKAGERTEARAALDDLIGDGLERRAQGLPVEERRVLGHRVAVLAEELGAVLAAVDGRELEYAAALEEAGGDDTAPPALGAAARLAVARQDAGDFEGALALNRRVYDVRERMLAPDDPALTEARANLAVSLGSVGDLEGALELAEAVVATRARLLAPDHDDLVRAQAFVAVLRFALGDYERALALRERVYAVLSERRGPDDPERLAAASNLAITRAALGDEAGALAPMQQVVDAYTRLYPPDHPDLLSATANLALLLEGSGQVERRVALLERVHDARAARLDPDHPDVLRAAGNLADALADAGEHARARALRERVLAARERALPPGHPELLTARANLALSLSTLGDVAGAADLREAVYAALIAVHPPDHPDVLDAATNLAASRLASGDLQGADALCARLVDTYRGSRPPDDPDLVRALANLAVTREVLGSSTEALELREEVHALLAARYADDHPRVLDARHNLANSRFTAGDLAGALALREQVHAGRSRGLPADHEDRITATANLAISYASVGDDEGLARATMEVFDAQRLVAQAAAFESPRVARAAVVRGLERLSALALWCERLDDGSERAPWTSELLASLEALRRVSTLAVAAERGAAHSDEARSLRERLALVRRRLAEASQRVPVTPDAVDAWRRELVDLAVERDRLARALRFALVSAGVEVDLPDAASIAADLGEEEVYVGYWRYQSYHDPEGAVPRYRVEPSYLAFVVERDGRVRRIELGAAEAIEDAIERWRDALGAPVTARGLGLEAEGDAGDAEEAVRAARALRALVLDPVLAVAPDATTLRVVPDEALFLVPFDALADGDEGGRDEGDGVVGDRLAVRVSTSAARQASARESRDAAPSLVVVGGVDYAAANAGAPALGPLPGTVAEADAIAARFEEAFDAQPVHLRAKDATKPAVASAAERARFVHVATHGWFAPRAAARSMLDRDTRTDASTGAALARSAARADEAVVGFLPETLCGLALAGANAGPEGILTAEELRSLDLIGCELAVLSACETNVGIRRAGQGIQSLQTALHAAGARTAITSLWKVDDAATRRLFEVFYTKLWQDGLGAADALWQAKMTLRGEGYEVRDWAGWVLTGDPDRQSSSSARSSARRGR